MSYKKNKLLNIINQNIFTDQNRQAIGVAACDVDYDGKEEILEVYIFNYSGNLYRKRIKVSFVEKIRNEEKFNSDNDLIVRMKKDCEHIKKILTRAEVLDNN